MWLSISWYKQRRCRICEIGNFSVDFTESEEFCCGFHKKSRIFLFLSRTRQFTILQIHKYLSVINYMLYVGTSKTFPTRTADGTISLFLKTRQKQKLVPARNRNRTDISSTRHCFNTLYINDMVCNNKIVFCKMFLSYWLGPRKMTHILLKQFSLFTTGRRVNFRSLPNGDFKFHLHYR